nr:Ig-like domain-containing protein [Oscillochloris trichoides]
MQVMRRLAQIWTVLLAVVLLLLGGGLLLRWLAPGWVSLPAPLLLRTTPTDGAVGVLPRHELVLQFAGPMNRAATEAALRLDPPTPGHLHWSDDARTLTFVPATTLLPDTDYTLLLEATAQGQWWQPLPTPLRIQFRTAALPAVVSALPQGEGVALDSAMAIIFSQPMVAEATAPPFDPAYLQIEPPLAVSTRWLDAATLLIQPQTPLHAATHYTATISADLTDLRGVALGQPFVWRWSTAWPQILDLTPHEAERWVGPHQPWIMTLNAPLDLARLRAALRITPPTEYGLSSAQIGATQVVTITPTLHWDYDQAYQVLLEPSDPSLADPPPLVRHFRVAPEPGLIAFFPGHGQTLALDQDVRLIFRTPMDVAGMQAGLQIDPLVEDLHVQVAETEVRLQAQFAPSTTYTLTLNPDLADRSGEPLGITETVQLRTAPADPLLRVPAAQGHLLALPPCERVQFVVEHSNLSLLDLSLYQLDLPTLVRAINVEADQWRDFDPDRYAQTLLRRWQVTLTDPADQLVQNPIDLALPDGSVLPQGFYYLRVRSPEGPQLDLLVQISNLNLSLQASGSQLLVWATQHTTGQPLADLPLLLYAGDALLARGQTDADGVWVVPVAASPAAKPYLVLADGAQPALVRSQVAAPVPQMLLALDHPRYRPGERVNLAGMVRHPPMSDAACRMQLETPDALPLVQAACRVEQGSVRGSLEIPTLAQAPPPALQLRVQWADLVASVPVNLDTEAPAAPPQVRMNLRSRLLTVAERPYLELFSLDAAGQPLPDQALKVTVARAGVRDAAPLLLRTLRTDAHGRAELELVQLQAGQYQVVASLGDVAASAPLWVTRAGYRGWEHAPGSVEVVTDRDSYQPGDVARILITAPVANATLLLTWSHAALVEHQVQALRAGEIVELEITPQMAPALNVDAQLSAGGAHWHGAHTIVVAPPDPPDLGLTLAPGPYAPGATATMTITNPLVREVLVTMLPAETPDLLNQFALWQAGASDAGIFFTGTGDLVTPTAGEVRIELPAQRGEWRLRLYALLANGQIITEAMPLSTQQPIDLLLHAPPTLRMGDAADITLTLHNTTPISQSVEVRLLVLGGELDAASAALHNITLEAGASQDLVWRVTPRQLAQVLNLRYSLRGSAIHAQISQPIDILPNPPAAPSAEAGLRVATLWYDRATAQPISLEAMQIGQEVALDLTLIAAQALPVGQVQVELPAAFSLTAQHLPPGLSVGDLKRLNLPLAYPDLAPGVYRVRLELRVTYAGRFRVNPVGAPMIVSEP